MRFWSGNASSPSWAAKTRDINWQSAPEVLLLQLHKVCDREKRHPKHKAKHCRGRAGCEGLRAEAGGMREPQWSPHGSNWRSDALHLCGCANDCTTDDGGRHGRVGTFVRRRGNKRVMQLAVRSVLLCLGSALLQTRALSQLRSRPF